MNLKTYGGHQSRIAALVTVSIGLICYFAIWSTIKPPKIFDTLKWSGFSTNRLDSQLLGPHLKSFNRPDGSKADQGVYIHLDDEGLASGRAFVRIQEAGATAKVLGVSMFHQLHCIEMLRANLQRSSVGPQGHPQSGVHGKEDSHKHALHDDDEDDDHLIHCLDYLAQVRQAPIC
jgi:hypothetical protein